jgi:transcriptional regulator with XRE-family HTH domain
MKQPAVAARTTSRVPRTSIGKRGLALRRASRLHPSAVKSVRAVRAESENYAARVLSGEFEPTAPRARRIAESQGESLHALAHRLGYADAPPRVRTPVDLSSLTRREVASRTRYHISDVSRLFARKHPPTLTKLARVAKAYGAWMDDVLTALGW